MKLLVYKVLLITLFAIKGDYQLIKKINKKTDFIAIDDLGYLYLHENNKLQKYTNTGDLLNNYTNLTYGKLSFFDASDPYMLLLYYKELNKIVFLDNQLTPMGSPIDLDKLELYQVDKVCKSKEFAIWIYDDFDKRLIQYAFNPKGILNEINLNLLNISEDINFMREAGNRLYLSTNKHLYIFDIYGSLIKKVNIDIPHSFEISYNKLIYYKNNKLISYFPDENKTDTLSVGFTENSMNVLLNDELLYSQKKDSVLIFKLN